MLKLHIGCGKRFLSGYTHVDLADFAHINIKSDVKILPFKDSSAELIYASHVFEYFDRVEATNVLKEWYRVLVSGGTLRLAVPNFVALMAVYRATGNLDKIAGPLYGRWPIPGTSTTVYHKTVYDFNSLTRILEQAGFTNPRLWDWRKIFVGEHVGYDDHSQAYFPHMDKDNGVLTSLNVEATK